jgi:molybdate transport system substrate-binding protein
MAAVASGGVEAGVVYRTDAASSESVSVVYEVPKDDGPDVVYSGAISLTSSNVADAALFLEFITDEFRGAAQRHGFGVLAKD